MRESMPLNPLFVLLRVELNGDRLIGYLMNLIPNRPLHIVGGRRRPAIATGGAVRGNRDRPDAVERTRVYKHIHDVRAGLRGGNRVKALEVAERRHHARL